MPIGVYERTEEHNRKISESMLGKKNHNWKGDEVGYYALHKWIQKNWGDATHCEICGDINISTRYEWHNKNRQYNRKVRKDWMQVCSKCHKMLDKQLKEI